MHFRDAILGLLAFFFVNCAQTYIVDGSRINRPKLLSFAKEKLPNHGIIEQAKNGQTYVKLPPEYVSKLLTQTHLNDFKMPSYSNENLPNKDKILVIDPEEGVKITQLNELGKTIYFNPLGFYTQILHDKEYLMLAVDCPELSNMRMKYGLSEQIANHAFSITIGVRQLVAQNELAP